MVSRQATNLWTNLWRTRLKPADAAGESWKTTLLPPPLSQFFISSSWKWVDHQHAAAAFWSWRQRRSVLHHPGWRRGLKNRSVSFGQPPDAVAQYLQALRDGSVYLRTLQRGCFFCIFVFFFCNKCFSSSDIKKREKKTGVPARTYVFAQAISV